MNRKPVNSSSIQSVGYDEASHTMQIEFKSGTVYEYYHVPRAAYDGLMKAPSHGQYFLAYIKEGYPYRRLR